MKLKLIVFFLALTCFSRLFAQDPEALKYGSQISSTDLKENLSILSSDALEGRETGKRGQKMAAAFIKAHFEEIGLAGPLNGEFYQPVELYTSVPSDIYVKAGENKFQNFQEVVYYGSADSEGEVTLPVVFGGKGRKEDFEQLDVKDKAVVLWLSGEDFRTPISYAREQNAKMVLVCIEKTGEFKQMVGRFKNYMGGGTLSLKQPESAGKNAGVFFISAPVAEKIFNTTHSKLTKAANDEVKKASLKKFKTSSVQYKTSMDVKVVKTENVLGYLEGTDKKDEVIVITAHYDHIGKRSGSEGDLINNGADDDGSGTVAVMELARVFTQAKNEGKGPRRSILFMTVTGEEKGLLGSDYYTQHPVFSLSNTVVNLNIDMVGRRDAQHKDSPPYVYVIGSDKLSADLHTLSETVNKTYTNLIFDYTYNDQNHPDRLYYRSDHWNFAKNNIPIIFYFDGIHEDYHKPSDEVHKIEFDLLTKRSQCIFYTAWEIANREQRIVADEKAK